MTATDATTAEFRQFSNPATGESITVHHDRPRRRRGCRSLQLAEPARRFDHRAPTPPPGGALRSPPARRTSPSPASTRRRPGRDARRAHRRASLGVQPRTGRVEGVVELRPALHTKEMFEAFGGLGSEGKTTLGGHRRIRSSSARPLVLPPREPGHLTADLDADLILPPLAALAKVFGVRPYYERWDSRIPSDEPERTP